MSNQRRADTGSNMTAIGLAVVAGLGIGGVCVGAVPPASQWRYTMLAREGTASTAFGVPAGAELVQNDPTISSGLRGGRVAVKYATSPTSDGVFVWSRSEGAVAITSPGNYGSSADFADGFLALSPNAVNGYTSVDVLSVPMPNGPATIARQFGLGGFEGITGSFQRPRLFVDQSTNVPVVGYRASSGSTQKWLMEWFEGSTRRSILFASSSGTTASPTVYSFLYSPTLRGSALGGPWGNYFMGGAAGLTARGVTTPAALVQFRANGFDPSVPLVRQPFVLASNPQYNALSNLTDMNDQGEFAFFVRNAAGGIWELRTAGYSDGGTGNVLLERSIVTAETQGIGNSDMANFPPVIFGGTVLDRSDSMRVVGLRPRRAPVAGDPALGQGYDGVFVGDGQGLVRLAGDGDVLSPVNTSPVTLGFGTTFSRFSIIGNIAIGDASSFDRSYAVAFIARLNDGADALMLAEAPRPTGPCGFADVGTSGGIAGSDGLLNNNDFVVFINLFFAGNRFADVGSLGGVGGSDGAFDNNDFVAFLNLFFGSPCAN